MTGESQPPETRPCGADVAAYALGALDPAEVEAFRRHLDSCVVCRDELATFQQVVDLLPMSAAEVRAPKALRRRVLREVEQESRAQVAREPRRRARFLGARLALPRPALALGAAVAAVAVVIGGIELGSTGAARTQVYRAQVIGSTGSAEVRVSAGRAELVVHHLAPPPAGQIYEVWLARPHHAPQPTSALFSVTASGAGDVDVPGSLHGVTLVMVTPEPAGGSQVPTHPAVIRAQLS